MTRSTRPGHAERRARRRRGGAAVEFALVFPLFFALLYGLVNYGLLFALQQSMVVAAEDAARAAVACDPAQDPDDHEDCVVDRARATAGIALAWLPSSTQGVILGADNGNVLVELEDAPPADPSVSVTLTYPNYSSNPLLPPLISWTVLVPGQIPPLPSQLTAVSVVRL